MNGEHKNTLDKFLFSKISIAPLVLFRIAIGFFLLVEYYRFWTNGHIQNNWIAPRFHFTYIFFDWVQLPPGNSIYLIWTLMAIAAFCVAIGFYYRVNIVICFLIWTYGFLLESTCFNNHYYFTCILLFIAFFLPLERSFSLDARRNPEIKQDECFSYNLWLIRIMVSIPYAFGGIIKINTDWFAGEPIRTWLHKTNNFPFLQDIYTQEWFVYFVIYSGVLFDLLIVPFLLTKKTRPYAFITATIFHLSNSLVFHIGIFPWLMICLTLLYFDPDTIKAFFSSKRKKAKKKNKDEKKQELMIDNKRKKLITVLFFSFFTLQILLPLRTFLYPGNPAWTLETTEFSWRMKHSDIYSETFFLVYDPNSKNLWDIDDEEFLEPRQKHKMRASPRLMLRYAKFIKEYLIERGYPKNIQIKVDSKCSLNSRSLQRKVDPEIDLASETLKLGHYDWILPLE